MIPEVWWFRGMLFRFKDYVLCPWIWLHWFSWTSWAVVARCGLGPYVLRLLNTEFTNISSVFLSHVTYCYMPNYDRLTSGESIPSDLWLQLQVRHLSTILEKEKDDCWRLLLIVKGCQWLLSCSSSSCWSEANWMDGVPITWGPCDVRTDSYSYFTPTWASWAHSPHPLSATLRKTSCGFFTSQLLGTGFSNIQTLQQYILAKAAGMCHGWDKKS